MIDILTNLILDLKNCLAIALGIGLLTGYIYTKLRSREIYKPEIDRLNEKIDIQDSESKSFISKTKEIEEDIEKLNSSIKENQLHIKKIQEDIHDFEIQKIEKLRKESRIIERFNDAKNTLTTKEFELKELKNRLEVDDLSNIEAKSESINSKISQNSKEYSQKQEVYSNLLEKKKEIEEKKIALEEELLSLNKTLDEKEEKLSKLIQNRDTLKEELQNRYDSIVRDREDDLQKIEEYKSELLKIKQSIK